jgi:hypothetical protein
MTLLLSFKRSIRPRESNERTEVANDEFDYVCQVLGSWDYPFLMESMQ